MHSPLFANPSSEHRFVDIILPLNLPQTLTYGIPHEMQGFLQPGMRVEVSLGKNKQYAGVVERVHNEQPEAYQVKPIKGIIDEEPIVNIKQLQFWKWIAHYYIAAPGEVMQAALPAHLKMMGETRLLWAPEHEDVVYDWSYDALRAVEILAVRKELSITDLRSIVGGRKFMAVLHELLENETVVIDDSLESSYKPKKEKIISLAAKYNEEPELIKLFDELQRAPKQLELLMGYVQLSKQKGFVRQADLLERTQASAAQIKSLADKGVFIIAEKEVDRLLYEGVDEQKEIEFTPAQQKAYNELNAGLSEKEVVLLEGVTGSGKTLLYIHKIKEYLASGKQAIFLLPEIALTTQLVGRLRAYFGEELGVYHSRFSNNERVEIWEKVQSGKYRVVVGPRSALWLPYNDLGLIVVDEEHDGSYKQKDPAPRFHARDAAIYLGALHGAKVILGSATPSIESLFNAQNKKYGYVRLNERYLGVQMPQIEIVNATSLNMVRQQGVRLLTPELQQAIAIALKEKKQVILFQNRRGYAPFQMCTSCGWVPQCKNCAVSLTYHKITDKLHCHYCGLKSPVVHTCAYCGSNSLVSKTFGTEKIEEEVQQVFPKARVARMDIDSMRNKQSLPQLLDQLGKQKIDILVGTQMVVKGLDFATVGLVGILSADSLLSYPDFRVNERAFQLMEQVSGRAGRADGAGKVLIQVYNLQHPVLKWVKDHDVHGLYHQEIKYREQFGYPPFSRIIKIIFRHKEEPKAIQAAAEMANKLASIEGIGIQGPAPALVARVRNLYIQEVWIKCPQSVRVLEHVKSFIKEERLRMTGERGFSSLQVVFDIDPVG
ncbi:replication restart helicase PriA [Taibaiella soli]|uniref:Replication restart protein PriA n=1 Tax=Taibaiella soli TaxID=1649169 RepID=A0A2W2AHA3_9BACT|nr:primosomal protein N' [Taibaiella soli]PZF72922.1 primosomal protein N' [Taibaiella soli]